MKMNGLETDFFCSRCSDVRFGDTWKHETRMSHRRRLWPNEMIISDRQAINVCALVRSCEKLENREKLIISK